MALSILDISLQEAIEACGLACLPDELDQESSVVWLKAIGLVRKVNGTRNYALLENDGTGVKIKRDFGSIAQIVEVTNIYPYEKLEKRFMPKLLSDEDTIKYLKKHTDYEQQVKELLCNLGKTSEQIKKDRERIRKLVIKVAIEQAQGRVDEEIKYRKYLEQKRKEDGAERAARKARRSKKTNNSEL
jgi:hypothetical protein